MPKTYNINISHATFEITHDRLVKTLPHGINQLKEEYNDEVELKPLTNSSIDSVKLKEMIEGYSEQLTPYAEEDLIEWFSYTSGRMFKTNYPDLFYFSDKPYEANKSSVAAIGEGIAGYLMTNIFGYGTLARPIGNIPDILMEKDGKIAFVEAKASISYKGKKGLETIIKNTAIELLELIAKAQYNSPKYVGFVIGTTIKDGYFDVSIVELVYKPNVSSLRSMLSLRGPLNSINAIETYPYNYKGFKEFKRANYMLADKINERTQSLEGMDKNYDYINELLIEEIYKNMIMEDILIYLFEETNPNNLTNIGADYIIHKAKKNILELFGDSDYIQKNLSNHDAEIKKKVERIFYLREYCM
jgi:hypothetical protein